MTLGTVLFSPAAFSNGRGRTPAPLVASGLVAGCDFFIFFFFKKSQPISEVTEVVGLAEQGWELQS